MDSTGTEFDTMEESNKIETNEEYEQEANWIGICNMVQSALYETCDVYVNDNRILTTEGERAFGCIRNGALLGRGALTLGLPPGIITKGMVMLSAPTGCDGIVNFQALNALANLDVILGFLN